MKLGKNLQKADEVLLTFIIKVALHYVNFVCVKSGLDSGFESQSSMCRAVDGEN